MFLRGVIKLEQIQYKKIFFLKIKNVSTKKKIKQIHNKKFKIH